MVPPIRKGPPPLPKKGLPQAIRPFADRSTGTRVAEVTALARAANLTGVLGAVDTGSDGALNTDRLGGGMRPWEVREILKLQQDQSASMADLVKPFELNGSAVRRHGDLVVFNPHRPIAIVGDRHGNTRRFDAVLGCLAPYIINGSLTFCTNGDAIHPEDANRMADMRSSLRQWHTELRLTLKCPNFVPLIGNHDVVCPDSLSPSQFLEAIAAACSELPSSGTPFSQEVLMRGLMGLPGLDLRNPPPDLERVMQTKRSNGVTYFQALAFLAADYTQVPNGTVEKIRIPVFDLDRGGQAHLFAGPINKDSLPDEEWLDIQSLFLTPMPGESFLIYKPNVTREKIVNLQNVSMATKAILLTAEMDPQQKRIRLWPDVTADEIRKVGLSKLGESLLTEAAEMVPTDEWLHLEQAIFNGYASSGLFVGPQTGHVVMMAHSAVLKAGTYGNGDLLDLLADASHNGLRRQLTTNTPELRAGSDVLHCTDTDAIIMAQRLVASLQARGLLKTSNPRVTFISGHTRLNEGEFCRRREIQPGLEFIITHLNSPGKDEAATGGIYLRPYRPGKSAADNARAETVDLFKIR